MSVFSSAHRWQNALRCAAVACLAASCTTLQVPLNLPTYDRQELLIAGKDGIEIRVRPVAEKDEYLNLFDDYLPEIGMVTVWVEMHNRRDAAVEIAPAQWRLSVAERDYPALDVPGVFQQYYDRRGVRMYSLKADSAARRDMGRIVLRPGILPSLQQCKGWLFFRLDPATASNWPRAATLIAKDIRLDRKFKATIEIPLSHANP